MKKVGILSMQRIANYGSFLQAYGLKCILEDLGCEVQFVDFHPGNTLVPSKGGTGIKRKLYKTIETIKYNAPLKEKLKFIKYKKNYAANYYPYLGLGEMNYSPKVDVLIIGSDEVFNCVQSNTNVGFSLELFGANNKANNVITYAASFGNTTIEKLKEYDVEEIISYYLNNLSAISVRDENSGKIAEKLTDKKIEYHLDPVLVYDFIGKCCDIPTSILEDNYMILYGYAGRFSKEECNKIRQYAENNGWKIFCIGGVQDSCDSFIACNPFEVIAYFQHAKCVVTDTFHGTILSVITHRQFVSVIRKAGYGNEEKMRDLLRRLNLEDRAIDNLSMVSKMMNTLINYSEIDSIISMERIRTYEYLKKQIGDIE